ncbi:MAG: hypothetical protein FWE47_00665 [Oscillospiraceae bacterium]|nr:hypothetical protein [Oscillospiraceae bacterium]
MTKPNYIYKLSTKIKSAIADANIPYWAVAHCVGIDESTLSRWFRKMTPRREQKIYGAIEQAKDYIQSIESRGE